MPFHSKKKAFFGSSWEFHLLPLNKKCRKFLQYSAELSCVSVLVEKSFNLGTCFKQVPVLPVLYQYQVSIPGRRVVRTSRLRSNSSIPLRIASLHVVFTRPASTSQPPSRTQVNRKNSANTRIVPCLGGVHKVCTFRTINPELWISAYSKEIRRGRGPRHSNSNNDTIPTIKNGSSW
jgi:hypothetical protein